MSSIKAKNHKAIVLAWPRANSLRTVVPLDGPPLPCALGSYTSLSSEDLFRIKLSFTMMIIYCYRIEKILFDNLSVYLFSSSLLFYFFVLCLLSLPVSFRSFGPTFFLFGLERSSLGNSEPKREGLSIVFSHD